MFLVYMSVLPIWLFAEYSECIVGFDKSCILQMMNFWATNLSCEMWHDD